MGREFVNCVVCEDALLMSFRYHAQRSSVCGRIIQVEAQGDNLRQSAFRSMSVQHSFFDRPRSPAGAVIPFLEGQSPVLMPNDQPVSVPGLREEGGSVRDC